MGTPRWARQHFENVVMQYHGKRRCLIWPYATNDEGYAQLGDNGKVRRVGQLICERLYGPAPPKHECRHSCGNGQKRCVTQEHVSWGTRQQNQQDRKKHGTANPGGPSGELSNLARITERKARAILAAKGKQRDIAARHGVSQANVSRIKSRKIWSHI